ncbi:MAG: sodium/proton-translocating pyrophosphatase [Acidimicrobiales bacterium]|nr:sodium/proton-translocating pyrophosphatase [Acidimicrobiales bacterium]
MVQLFAAEGGYQEFTLRGGEWFILIGSALTALLALAVGFILMKGVLAADQGTPKMIEIAKAIQEGALAYLKRQFRTIGYILIPLAIIVFITSAAVDKPNGVEALSFVESGGFRTLAFIAGCLMSGLTGFIGMGLAVRGNVRTAAAAREGKMAPALQVAFRTGGVCGMFCVGLGLIGATLIMMAFQNTSSAILVGFGFGGSLLALFLRVGGGIFTKAADVGADLVGKVEAGIPEDDPRNPATIADNVGDNVGDCAGMASDLFESYEVTLVASIILGVPAFQRIFPENPELWAIGAIFPLAARAVGVRFHPTRGSMSLSAKDGGLPPDSVVQDDDTILAASEEAVARHHDPSPGAMVRVALAPCSPFSVTPDLMRRTAELAERLDVRLHTHLAEDPDEDRFCLETYGRRPIEHFEDVGWGSDRAWVAHCIYPSESEIARMGAWGTGVAHCPTSNMMIGGGGIAPVADYRAAGVPVGLGCDGSASTDAASLWMEARGALLLGRQRGGPTSFTARDALEIATRGSAACLGRLGELGVLAPGAAADLVAWKLDGLSFAGALTDPVEALLRCGPTKAHHTVVAGNPVVEAGELRVPGVADILARHRVAAARLQGVEP